MKKRLCLPWRMLSLKARGKGNLAFIFVLPNALLLLHLILSEVFFSHFTEEETERLYDFPEVTQQMVQSRPV